MRISERVKRNIKITILRDLYDAAENAHTSRKSAIAKQNREYQLAPIMADLDRVPQQFLTTHQTYSVRIDYGADRVHSKRLVCTWAHYFDNPEVNPVNNNGYGNCIVHNDLDPRLYAEAAELAEDIIALREEKSAMEAFLKTTLDIYSGPAQLKKAWPESLHKYIPATKTRVKKTVNTSAVADLPEALNIRLVTNLLEDN